MKHLKVLALASMITVFAGCSSNSTKQNYQITVGASVKESIEILDRRGTLNDTLCRKTSISLECELLNISADDPNHQFMNFDLYEINGVTKINVTRWIMTNGSDKKKTLDLSQSQLDSIAEYIERHRNRMAGQ